MLRSALLALVLAAPASADDAASDASEAAPSGVTVGEPAPDFTLPDLDGASVSLSDFEGKTVVLEWFNPGCPFVVNAHTEGPLEDMATRWAEQDVVWLAINSGAPGKQGHGVEVNREAAASWTIEHPLLLDESGDVGRRYGATNTPHMYVIDEAGVLRYQGALDNAPLGKVRGGSHDVYVEQALTALAAGEPVSVDETKAYGCDMKY